MNKEFDQLDLSLWIRRGLVRKEQRLTPKNKGLLLYGKRDRRVESDRGRKSRRTPGASGALITISWIKSKRGGSWSHMSNEIYSKSSRRKVRLIQKGDSVAMKGCFALALWEPSADSIPAPACHEEVPSLLLIPLLKLSPLLRKLLGWKPTTSISSTQWIRCLILLLQAGHPPQEEKKVGVAKGEFGLLVSQGKTLV